MGWWRGVTLSVLIIGALALVFTFSGLPSEPSGQSVSGRLLNSGIYLVGDIDYRLIDTARPTAAHGGFAGLAHRELDTRVWFPRVEDREVAPGRHPLLVYSHGFYSGKVAGAYLASYMAGHGYIVVAADFPLTRIGAPGGPVVEDVVNQPGDISFLIDTLLDWDSDPDSPFFERIDAGRIGVLGVSLGGLTSTLAAFHPELRDPRISLAVSIGGPSSLFDASFFQASRMPFMVVASTSDALVDYAANAEVIPGKIPGATLVSIERGSHTGFSGLSRYLRWLDNPDAVVCHYLQRQPLQHDWYQLIGSPEQGVVDAGAAPMCEGELPSTINPVMQQWITTLAVFNFVQQRFGQTGVEIAAARNYLYNILPREFSGVEVDSD